MLNNKEMVILIAEDNEGHTELLREGLINSGICNQIILFSNGEEAWNFISGKGPGEVQDIYKSYLLLLDINMPKMDGILVLRMIKSNDELKNIPIIMLTTTDDPQEVEDCYNLGCNFYITKPVDFIKFHEILKSLGLLNQIIRI